MFTALGEQVLVAFPAGTPPQMLWLLGATAQPNQLKGK